MSRIEAVIEAYWAAASAGVEQLCVEFGVSDLFLARRAGVIPRRGVLAAGEFEFHGIGCRILAGGVSVEVEFLPGGEIGGFDAWRLHRFCVDNQRFGGGGGEVALGRLLDELAVVGRVVRVAGSGLFRLVGRA